jgi:transcriptional regulator with XRE-family HTH domain
MTLGEIIKAYSEDHSISQFIKDSGLSKAYVYMLIANKNNKGEPIAPSLETIQKVAAGMHTDFETVFSQLDYDFAVRVNPTIDDEQYYLNDETAQIAQEIFENKDMRVLFDAARDSRPEDLKIAADMLRRFKETNPNG